METKTSLSLGYPSEAPNCKISGPSLRQTAFEQFLRSSIGKNSVAGLAITKEIAPRGAACVKRLRTSSPRSSAKRDSQRSAPFEDEAWSTGGILWASDSPQMKVPRPTWPLIKPSDSSSAYAFATVVRCTPNITASSRLAGIRSPGRKSPACTSARNWSRSWTYRGTWLSGWRCTGSIGSPLAANSTRHWTATRANLSLTLECGGLAAAFGASPQASPLPSANPFAAEALVPRRVIPDSPVRLPRTQLPHAKARQIILIALVDLRHRQISRLHDVFPHFHLLRSV